MKRTTTPRVRRLLIGALSALALQLAPLQTFAAQQKSDDTLLEAFHLILDNHYTHPDENALLQAAIKGMLDSLDDPFSNYMSAEEYQDFMNAINQSYAGIGITIEADEVSPALVVAGLVADAPASKAGILAGDRIVKIDGVAITADTLEAAPAKIRGKEGTAVTLQVVRNGKRIDFTVIRASLQLPEVSSDDLGDGIAYIRIFTFGDNTASEFDQALKTAAAKKPNGLVLDLRGNGGGSVLAALEVADQFLKSGKILIVHDQGEEAAIEADSEGTDLPVTVLIDENTASASEMLAGALQRNGRAKLVGVTSYGKGTMQAPYDLPNGSELKVSVDNWELPDGTSIQKTGLTPDVYIERPEAAVNAAKQLLLPDRKQTLTLSRTSATGKLNGTIKLIDVPAPRVAGGVTYVPLRYVFESFGSQIDWDPDKRLILFEHEGKKVTVDLLKQAVTVDGKKVPVTQGIRSFGGSAYVSTAVIKAITGSAVNVTSAAVTMYSK